MSRRIDEGWSDDFSPWGGPSDPDDYRRWHLQDTLERIDAAEKLQQRGHSGHGWEGLQLRILAGRTPDQARADAHARYAPA